MGSIGENIRRIRKERKMSQDSLAEAAGIHRVTLANYEIGRKENPSAENLAAIADALGVPITMLLGERGDRPLPPGFYAADGLSNVPVIGSIKAGPGGLAVQEVEGYELADVRNADEYLWLRIVGDSMEPEIHAGDLALIHRQECVESGELAAVIVNGEEGTVIYSGNAIILQAFNPKYPPRVFSGRELDDVRIVGKVTETKRKW